MTGPRRQMFCHMCRKPYHLNNPGEEPYEHLVRVRCVMRGTLRKVQIPPLFEKIQKTLGTYADTKMPNRRLDFACKVSNVA